MLMRLINFATGYGLVLFAAFLFVLTFVGPITAWGAEPTYLTIDICAADPLDVTKDRCERRYAQPFNTRVLCERAVDLDGDGAADQVWLDFVARMVIPGQWVNIQCPPYKVPGP